MKLYQIKISREDCRRVNDGEPVAAYEAHVMAMCHGEFPGREYYTHVADIAARDLDEAFEIGNVGPETLIVRHDDMHSVSVGDVLEHNGTGYIVQAFGFRDLNNW